MSNKLPLFPYWPSLIPTSKVKLYITIAILLMKLVAYGQIQPLLLYAEGKKPGFVTNGKPYIFIELNTEKKLKAYIGFHAYKGRLYDGCWLSDLIAVNDSVYEGLYRPNSDEKSLKVRLLLGTNQSMFYIEEYGVYELGTPDNLDEINDIRNKIYATSLFRIQEYKKLVTGIFSCNKSNTQIYAHPLFRLPHEKFIKEVENIDTTEEWNALFCY